MRLFDVSGPIMTGPSSSHTAGAVKIGLVTRAMLGGEPARASILLHGSFAQTGRGHGTDRAIVAGLFGLCPGGPPVPGPLTPPGAGGGGPACPPAHIKGMAPPAPPPTAMTFP